MLEPPNETGTSRSFIVFVRVLLLAAAAAAAVVAVAVTVRARAAAHQDSGARFACPMHPEVRSAEPGQCPICRMALEPVARDPIAGASSRALAGMAADLTAVENIRKHRIFEFVRSRALLPTVRELRGPAWVEGPDAVSVVLYKDQIEILAPDEPATFTLAGSPEITFAVRRAPGAPQPWDSSTARVAFTLERAARGPVSPALPAGKVGWLTAAPRPRSVITIPASALLQSPEGPYVLVPAAGGGFEKRSITLGETFVKPAFAVVLSGLREHDLVVGRAAFFVDADRRISSRADESDWSAP